MIRNFLYTRFIQPEVEKEIASLASFSTIETDDTFNSYTQGFRSRTDYKRKEVIEQAFLAWRVNPLARRIVEITTSFVIGNGIEYEDKNEQTTLETFWKNDLNKMDDQVVQWSEELTITGDLFLLFTVSRSKELFVRTVPSEQIEKIEHVPNDYMQETFYRYGIKDEDKYPAYDSKKNQNSFMLHFAINRPAGANFGESDFTPILVWLDRYAKWLENRALLNKFRTAFMYVLRGSFANEKARREREKAVRQNPPKPGSILVTDATESWGILSASLDSFDASVDGDALKKMIAAGIGYPMHWLADPESSTRTTAAAAGTPTFRKLTARQNVLRKAIKRTLELVLITKGKKSDNIVLRMPDITERDNTATALTLVRTIPALGDLYDRDLIDQAEYLRLVYRLASEEVPEYKGEGLRKPLTKQDQSTTEQETDGQEDTQDIAVDEGVKEE